MKSIKNNTCAIGFSLTIIALIAVSFWFGFTGFRTLALIVLIYFVPIHMIMSKFALTPGEIVMFSFALSAAIVPTITYYIGFLVGMKWAIWVGFIILLIIAFLVNKNKFKKQEKKVEEFVKEEIKEINQEVKETIEEVKKEN